MDEVSQAASEAAPLVAIEPLAGRRNGGALLVARAGQKKLLIVADEDAASVRVVDADLLEEVSRARVGRVSQVAIGAGRVFAAIRDEDQVVALALDEAGELHPDGQRHVAAEPVGLAVTPDGVLLVTSAWGGTLTALDAATLEERFSVEVGREPRGVTLGADGRTAFVAHALGSRISRVDLDRGASGAAAISLRGFDTRGLGRLRRRPLHPGGDFVPMCGTGMMRAMRRDTEERHAVQGFAVATHGDRIVSPQVIVHRGETSGSSGGYGSGEGFPRNEAVLFAIDAASGAGRLRVANDAVSIAETRVGFKGGERRDGCLLPRAVATVPDRDLILVSCVGSDEIVGYGGGDGPLSVSTRARWKVPAGPVGLDVDPAASRAFVWSQFDGAVSVLALPEPGAEPAPAGNLARRRLDRPLDVAALPAPDEAPAMSASAHRGRAIFHAVGDARISSDGRACASCHPDGRDDGLTWSSPNGPRQTPMLAGRLAAETAPYGWQGDAPSVAEHLAQTLQRLGGKGLAPADVGDLLAYLDEMAAPARAGDESSEVARGRELFHAETVGCATCHRGGTGSDGVRHDVGGAALVETPSLRFVGGTGPYFHDGRYRTLAQMLRATKGTMGWGGDLSDADLEALESYLRTL